jgi:phage shock protein C
MKQLYKESNDIVITGVLGGIANYTGYSVSLIRVFYVFFALISFSQAVVLYTFLSFVMPKSQLPIKEREWERHDVTLDSKILIGGILVLFGVSAITRTLFSWVNFGAIAAVIIISLGMFVLYTSRKGV